MSASFHLVYMYTVPPPLECRTVPNTQTNMLNYLLTAALFTASATAAPIGLSYGGTDAELTYAVAASGCGQSHNSGYNGPFTINSGGLSRSYKVMVRIMIHMTL